MAAPTVFFDPFTILLGSSVVSSEVFFGIDPDGDTIEKYELTDLNGNAGSVQAVVNGVIKPANQPFEVSDLSTLIFTGGTSIEKNAFRIRAYANGEWGTVTENFFYGVVQENQRPIIIGQDLSVVQSEKITLSEYFSFVDPDGFPLKRIRLLDANDGPTSAKIFLDGVEQPAQTWLYFWPDEFMRLEFQAAAAAPNNDPIYIRGFDRYTGNGVQDQGEWSFAINVNGFTTANINRPVGIPTEYDMPTEESVGLINLVAWTDADNNTAKAYRFFDTTAHTWSGNLALSGNPLPAGEWLEFDAAQLGNLTWESADRAFIEQVRFQVFDGNHWSDVETFRVRTNQKPIITVANDFTIVQQLEFVDVSDLLIKLDDGPNYTAYQIYDANTDPGSGEFRLGANSFAAGQIHDITPAQFFDLQFKSGVYEQRSLDETYFRAWNGTFWSDWTRHNIRTEPEYLDSLTAGSWANFRPSPGGVTQLTFSYMQQWPTYGTAGDATQEEFITPWAEMRALTRQMFERIEELVNVDFEEVADTVFGQFGQGGDIRLGTSCWPDTPVIAYASFPGAAEINGDIFFNRWHTGTPPFTLAEDPPCGFPDPDDPDAPIPPGWLVPVDAWDKGDANYATAIHELGHALGLKHPFDGAPILPGATNSGFFTGMSYGGVFPLQEWGQELYDISALQAIYGPNTSFNTGDTLYNSDYWRGTFDVVDSIWDAGGIDTIDASDQISAASFDLRPGGFNQISQGTISIAFDVDIENAIGTQFGDNFIGNELINSLIGGGGDDVFEAYGGDDFMSGGANNDTYIFKNDDGNDTINEMLGAGRDNIDLGLFIGLNNFSEDLSFTRRNFDMEINFTIDRGISRGSIVVEDQGFGRNRVETLNVLGVPVDLKFLFNSITEPGQRFAITGDMGQYGFEVTPV